MHSNETEKYITYLHINGRIRFGDETLLEFLDNSSSVKLKKKL